MRRHPLSMTIKFQKLHDDVQLPEYKTELAAGMDLHAWLPDGKIGIPPGERKVIETGLQVSVDLGYGIDMVSIWMQVF